MKSFLCLVSLLATLAAQQPHPPTTRRVPVVNDYHGVKVSDPYRWLEDQNSPATRKWIEAQTNYTNAVLRNQPALRVAMAQLVGVGQIQSVSEPMVRGNRLFYTSQRGGDQRPLLCYRDGIDGEDHTAIDPQTISQDINVSVDYQDASDDGHFVAYSVELGGADETEIRLRNLETGKDLPDVLPAANYSAFTLVGDMSGIFYCDGNGPHGPTLKYHKMGTPNGQDKKVFSGKYGPDYSFSTSISDSNRWLILTVSQGWGKDDIYAKDLSSDNPFRPIITGFQTGNTAYIAANDLYVLTNRAAPKGRILAYDLTRSSLQPQVVIPEGPDPIEDIVLSGGKLFVSRLHNVTTQITEYTPGGRKLGQFALPGQGHASLPSGEWTSNIAFYSYESYTSPTSIYSVDVPSGTSKIWHQTVLPTYDTAPLTTKQVWFTTKDHTKAMMTLVYNKNTIFDGKRPTLMSGYGGFQDNELPNFNTESAIFAQMGGVFVEVTLPGGGEFGEDWHRAGMLDKKQRVFDTFIAAAEYLEKHGITSPSKLAIEGGSNGGLLVAAAMTQRPELFQAVICSFPLVDMLRYDRFLQGPQWVPEYGSAKDPKQFKFLYKYSPYHHVRKGTPYPAVFIDSGDLDTRVAPLHARKMTAMLQWATSSKRPILLNYDAEAGHSGDGPLSKSMDHEALILAFLFWQLDMMPASHGRFAPRG